MNFKAKIAAVAVSAGVIASLAGCADVSYTLKVNDTVIKSGMYITYENTSIGEAQTKYKEENPDADTTAEGFDYFTTNVEGKTFSKWVQDNAVELSKQYVAVEDRFTALGLAFTDAERGEYKDYVNDTWDTENAYLQYYGIDEKTLGAYYESLGISKSSFQSTYVNNLKKSKIFDYYYSASGTEAVPESEVKEYFAANYARYRAIPVDLTDANGDETTTEEGLKVLEDLANGYVERLNGGEKFSDVKASYTDWTEQQKAAAEAADGTADTADTTDTAAEDTAAEVDENDNDTIITKTSTSPSKDFVTHIFEMENNKAELYKTEDTYYVLVRLDVSERTDKLEENRDTILHALRDDALTTKLDELAAAYTVEFNQPAVDMYKPEDLRK